MLRLNRFRLPLLGVLFVLILSVHTGRAQNFTGSVRGTVTDPQGASLAGANVKITNTDTAYTRSNKTDQDGSYDFQSLPLGR
jgi:hypothetical protein